MWISRKKYHEIATALEILNNKIKIEGEIRRACAEVDGDSRMILATAHRKTDDKLDLLINYLGLEYKPPVTDAKIEPAKFIKASKKK